jgi:phosphatidylserine/phosphatidylglycerophosphate/cardiolipin synthase-like enzyme
VIDVTSSRPPFRTTFTNGILSTQFLRNVLSEDGKIENGELERHLKAKGDWLRNYLSGDVLILMRDFFEMQQGGRFKAALYELEDEELVALLERHAERIDLILSDAGSSSSEDDDEPGSKTTLYDTRNQTARARLRAIAERPGTGFTLQDRMFNGSGHIGHNKFVVHLADGARGTSVLTGSTNWTWTGVAGQSNNCAVIEDGAVADGYLAYWNRLRDDGQPTPDPLSARAVGAGQHDALKAGNEAPVPAPLAGNGAMAVWYSPNMPGKMQPPTSKSRPVPPPPDMENLFSLMRKVQRAIFFLVFMPSRGGVHSIVSEAISLGLKDTALNVVGAISDTQAMWGFEPSSKTASGKKLPAWSPHVFKEAGVSVVRATALTDREIQRSLGDFKTDETLTLGRAIIHDKILVIDPHDPQACVVAFGSHNLGYKASYSNDENLVIVRGHQPLALAYTAHILDVYDHYRFRAVEAELAAAKAGRRANASAEDSGWDGFLATNDEWQAKASRRLATYFTGGV